MRRLIRAAGLSLAQQNMGQRGEAGWAVGGGREPSGSENEFEEREKGGHNRKGWDGSDRREIRVRENLQCRHVRPLAAGVRQGNRGLGVKC